MAGSATVRKLQAEGYCDLVLRSRRELYLTGQALACDFFAQVRPEDMFLPAAKVGGIHANAS